MSDLFFEQSRPAIGTPFRVRVTPNARQSLVKIEDIRTAHGTTEAGFHVSVQAPAREGEANRAVIAALSEAFGVAKSRVELVRGRSRRYKIFRLNP